MKLSRVWLKFSYRIPGSRMEDAQSELGERECATDDGIIDMAYDKDTHSLVFGECAYGINWDNVVRWERRDDELVCPTCERTFPTGKALGGHKPRCKGKAE